MRIRTFLLILLIAVAANVFVAWGFAVYAPTPSAAVIPMPPWTPPRPPTTRFAPGTVMPFLGRSLDDVDSTAWWCATIAPITGSLQHDSERGYGTGIDVLVGTSSYSLLIVEDPGPRWDRAIRIESGWPQPCMTGTRVDQEIEPAPRDWPPSQVDWTGLDGLDVMLAAPDETTFLAALRSDTLPGARHSRLLPLQPIWPAFVMNSALFAVPLLVPFMPGLVRSAVRLVRRRCVKCGYERGSADTCTECGQTRPTGAAWRRPAIAWLVTLAVLAGLVVSGTRAVPEALMTLEEPLTFDVDGNVYFRENSDLDRLCACIDDVNVEIAHGLVGRATLLHLAAETRQQAIVEQLIARGAHVNASSDAGMTPLHHSASWGDIEIARALLAGGAVMTAEDRLGQTPLHMAAACGWVDVVRLLLDAGAPVNAVDLRDKTPRDRAIGNRRDAVDALLASRGGRTRYTAAPLADETLALAVRSGDLRTARDMLDAGAEPNAVHGMVSLLTSAALADDLEMVDLLLDHGARPDPGTVGWAPLEAAVRRGHVPITERLLEAGASVLDTGRSSARCRYLAVARAAEICRRLIAAGAIVDCDRPYERTPLFQQVSVGRVGCAAALLVAGADATLVDSFGRTPLHLAAIKGHADCVQLLIDNDVPLDTRSNLGRTPLWCAAMAQDSVSITALLAAGADPDIADAKGRTPLHLTAMSNDTMSCNALVRGGADRYQEDVFGDTPYEAAIRWKSRAVAQRIGTP